MLRHTDLVGLGDMFEVFRWIRAAYRCSCLLIFAILIASILLGGVLVTNGTINLSGGGTEGTVAPSGQVVSSNTRPKVTNPAPLNSVITRRTLVAIVPVPQEITRRSDVLLANLLLTLFLTFVVGSCTVLLNRIQRDYDGSIRQWIASLRLGWLLRRFASIRQFTISRGFITLPLVLVMLALYGIIFAFLEPGLNILSPTGIQLALVLAVAVGIVSLGGEAAHRLVRRLSGVGERYGLRPANLLVAVLTTALSRAANLNPGILFAVTSRARGSFDHTGLSLFSQVRARALALVTFVILALIGILGWLATGGLADVGSRTLDPDSLNFVGPLAELGQTLGLTVFVVAAQTLFIQLLPLRRSSGRTLFRWNVVIWAVLFAPVTFTLLHTIVNPRGGVNGLIATPNLRAVLYCTVALVAITLAAWGYFRFLFPIFRRRPAQMESRTIAGPRWYTGPASLIPFGFRPPPPPPATMTPKIRSKVQRAVDMASKVSASAKGALALPDNLTLAGTADPAAPASSSDDEPTQPITPAGMSLRLPVPSYESLFPPFDPADDEEATPPHGMRPAAKPHGAGDGAGEPNERPGTLPT